MDASWKLIIALACLLAIEGQCRQMGGTLTDKDTIAFAILMAGWIIAPRTEKRRKWNDAKLE